MKSCFPQAVWAALPLFATGCMAVQPPAAVAPSAEVVTPVALTAAAVGDLLGRVTLPAVLAGADGVLPTGIGTVVAAGGQVLPTGMGTYRVMAIDAEWPVVGAEAVLRDPETRERLPGVAPAVSDGEGRFRFSGVPTGPVVLVDVAFRTADGRAFRLLTLAKASAPAPAVVDWRTTAATSTLLADHSALDPEALTPLIAALDARVAALPDTERRQLLDGLLAIPASGGEGAGPAPLPTLPALLSPSSRPLVGALASSLPVSLASPLAVASVLPSVAGLDPVSTVQSVASSVPSVLPSLLPSVSPSIVPSVAPLLASPLAALTSPLPSVLPGLHL